MSDYKVERKVLSNKITIYSRGSNPHYYYYFSINKKSFRGSTHSNNLDESEEFCILKYNEVKKNKGKVSNISFRECVNIFLEYKQPRLKPKTYKTYEIHSKFLLEYFKKTDPNTIDTNTYEDYERWRRDYSKVYPKKNIIKYQRNNQTIKMVKKPHSVGNTVINREVGLLRSILKYCYERNKLTIRKIPPWEKYKEKPREEYLIKEEYLKLKVYFTRVNPYYWLIISFLQNTGLRYPSELNELKWKDIKLDKSFMIIRNRKGKGDKEKDWSVPIVGTTKNVLERLKDRDVSTGPEDYVFVNDKGKRVINITRSFKKGLQECNITKKLSMYSLRHTFATRVVTTRPDIPLKILSETMGHVDVRMIEKHYGHLQPQHLVKYFQQSEDRKQEILNKQKQDQSETPTTTNED